MSATFDDFEEPDAGFPPPFINDEVRGGKIGGKKPVICSAAELRRKVFPAIRWTVDGYIAEGCTILAGRPKLGKSWLVLEAALAVASGTDCLGGIQCEEGDVLYLALEDNERRLQSRIDKLYGVFSDSWPVRFDFATEWPRANEGGLDAIRDWIRSKPNPRLIIVDVLAQFRPVRGDKETLYEGDYACVKRLQEIAGEYNLSIVIVHHTRKAGSDVDPFEKVSGSLGLSGAADTTMILDRDSNGCTIYGRGRDVEEIESAVTFDPAQCRWLILGKASEVRRSDERTAIIDVLREATEPLAPKEIMLGVEGSSRNAIDILLFKMAKAGEVVKAGRGLYTLPGRIIPPGKNGKKERLIGGDDDV
ncbi:MAG: AAA family ATPase [Beijerinckiaceae bacterium]|nr:AAA family ATPase [Beijerinckiaceae bacterium]